MCLFAARRYAPFPARLDPRLVDAMATRGISQLYAHQAEAVAAGLRGEHVAVVTPAASGKTLCYNLPVLNRLLADPTARALYLYPTKALAQDQLAELRALVGLLPPDPNLPVATYDGDTPAAQRTKIRDERARIVLSNPDMLHAGILPQHPRWAAFFAESASGGRRRDARLSRRLRVARRERPAPPAPRLPLLRERAAVLPGVCYHRQSQCGRRAHGRSAGDSDRPGTRRRAAGSERNRVLQSAPARSGARNSTQQQSGSQRSGSTFPGPRRADHRFRARTRLATELVLTELRAANAERRDVTRHSSPVTGQSIRGYRGGYLPTERREIERGLREGAVRAVVATNALELGIDIGQLDAAVLAGYPGTIASTRQQMGRAGRRQGVAVGVLVATADAIDQYLMAHPEYVLERSPEHARLNPDNEVILAGHLACAAAELPFEEDEHFGIRVADSQENPVPDLLADLVEAGKLYRSGGRYFWAGAGSPATAIGLRSSSPERVIIQNPDAQGKPQVIGEIERSSVLRFLYEGAVYLHEGTSYLVERLDWEAGIAAVRPVEVDFYTRPIIGEAIEVLATPREHPAGCPFRDCLGRCPRGEPSDGLQNPAPRHQRDAGLRTDRPTGAVHQDTRLLAGVFRRIGRATQVSRIVALRSERLRPELAPSSAMPYALATAIAAKAAAWQRWPANSTTSITASPSAPLSPIARAATACRPIGPGRPPTSWIIWSRSARHVTAELRRACASGRDWAA